MEIALAIFVIMVCLASWEVQFLRKIFNIQDYSSKPDVRVVLNAMKNFGRFAVIFGVLYWMQVQFGDAEAWLDAFRRD